MTMRTVPGVICICFPIAVGKCPEGPIGHSCESFTVYAM